MRPSAVPTTPPKEVLSQTFELTSDDDKLLGLDSEEPSPSTKSGQSVTNSTKEGETSSASQRGTQSAKEGAMRSDSASDANEEPRVTGERSEAGSEATNEANPAPQQDGPDLLRLKNKKETKTTSARDYTGFSEQETKLLKGMSNEAFEHFSKLLKSGANVTQPKQPDYIYQHPQGYTLHPEYTKLQQEVSYASKEANAWQEQLLAIREGRSWKPLVGVDSKGNFVYGAEKAPTLQDEEQVRNAMNKCLGHQQTVAQRLQSIPQQFNQIVQQDTVNIQKERASRFDWVAKPELLEHELDLGNGQKAPIKKVISDFISIFPAYRQGTPEVQVAADLFVALKIKDMQLREAEGQKVVAQTMVQERKQVEPSASTRQKATPGKATSKWGVDEFNMDGFPG